MPRLLKDLSGIFNLDHVTSLHPIPIKGDKQDQSKVTAVYTRIATLGGQSHDTNIPYDAATAIATDYWNPGGGVRTAQPAPNVTSQQEEKVAPPASAEDTLASAQQRYGG